MKQESFFVGTCFQYFVRSIIPLTFTTLKNIFLSAFYTLQISETGKYHYQVQYDIFQIFSTRKKYQSQYLHFYILYTVCFTSANSVFKQKITNKCVYFSTYLFLVCLLRFLISIKNFKCVYISDTCPNTEMTVLDLNFYIKNQCGFQKPGQQVPTPYTFFILAKLY